MVPPSTGSSVSASAGIGTHRTRTGPIHGRISPFGSIYDSESSKRRARMSPFQSAPVFVPRATVLAMCGIVGYAGSRPALNIVVDGLRRLEYRGYDSAGVAILDGEGELVTEKRAGKLANLE